MIAILCTFITVTTVALAVHRALGRPPTELLPLLKLCGLLTVTFAALIQGPDTLAALSGTITSLTGGGPSG